MNIFFKLFLFSYYLNSLLADQDKTNSSSIDDVKHRILEMKTLCQYDNSKALTITCSIDSGSFLPISEKNNTSKIPWDELIIVEYNIDRNGKGGDGPNEKGLDPIVEVLLSLGHIDIIILSEVARDCPSWERVNGAQYIAEKLKMDWAYSVEYMRTNEWFEKNGYQCTIGNAILSNKPLTNINQKVFKSQCCSFSGRAGGRVALKGTIPAFGITLVSSHLESGSGFTDIIEAMVIRERQSVEMVKMIDPDEKQKNIVLIGGDFNSPFQQFSNGEAFKNFYEPFNEKYSWPSRDTCVGDLMSSIGLGAFDYMYLSNHESLDINAEICKTDACYGYSDHFPLKLSIRKRKN